MKKIIYSLVLVIIALNSYSQNSNFEPFIGTWIWQENNRTFTVEIYSELDTQNNVYFLKGHYKMEETINGTTTLIYNSNKYITTQNNVDLYTGNTIYGGAYDNLPYFSGTIVDNVLWGDAFHTIKRGWLKFEITTTNPTTATWKVSKRGGVRTDSTPAEFSIPTDIILTKQ